MRGLEVETGGGEGWGEGDMVAMTNLFEYCT
jgi:hypothetical protein